MTFGIVHGVPLGARFRSRRSLYDAKMHRDIHRNICGGPDKAKGAESVILYDGDEDTLDLGQLIYYSGMGKRDARGRSISDQDFSGPNRALAVNVETGQPIRLIRAIAGEFEYAGLYVVEDAFLRPSTSGFQICQFRIRSLQSAEHPDSTDTRRLVTKRILTTHYRIARDPEVPMRIKQLYDYRCQVCSIRIETLAGAYSEGAHLVPLGGGADGPDIEANVVSLCPNHHVMLDHGSIFFTDDWRVFDRGGNQLGVLTVHPDHLLDPDYARMHRSLMGFDEPRTSPVAPTGSSATPT